MDDGICSASVEVCTECFRDFSTTIDVMLTILAYNVHLQHIWVHYGTSNSFTTQGALYVHLNRSSCYQATTSARWYGRQDWLVVLCRLLLVAEFLFPARDLTLWWVVKSHSLCGHIHSCRWVPLRLSISVSHTLVIRLSTRTNLHSQSLNRQTIPDNARKYKYIINILWLYFSR